MSGGSYQGLGTHGLVTTIRGQGVTTHMQVEHGAWVASTNGVVVVVVVVLITKISKR
jgi:hypothetical protein